MVNRYAKGYYYTILIHSREKYFLRNTTKITLRTEIHIYCKIQTVRYMHRQIATCNYINLFHYETRYVTDCKKHKRFYFIAHHKREQCVYWRFFLEKDNYIITIPLIIKHLSGR